MSARLALNAIYSLKILPEFCRLLEVESITCGVDWSLEENKF